MGSDQQFCLQWHNYQSSLLASLPQLLDSDDLTDVTLSAGGRNIKAHRVILSACSQYFKDLFKMLPPMQHPVIVLPGTNFTDLCALVTFMYSGEVNIYQEQLQGILSMAYAMQIRGLAEVNGAPNESRSKKDVPCSSAKRPRTATPLNFTSPLLNQALTETGTNCGLRPVRGTVCDTPEMGMGKDFESYVDATRVLTNKNKIVPEELHFGAGNKTEGIKAKNVENVEFFMPTNKTDKGRRSDPDTISYLEDIAYLSPNSSVLGSSHATEDARLKMEQEHQEFANPTNENNVGRQGIVPGSTASDVQKVSMMADCENAQDQQSPCSDDSAGSSTGLELVTERSHLNQGPHTANLKYASSQYSKLTTASHNSKLFAVCMVCGKQLSNQYNLRVHMETHQNVNYACRVCNHVSRSRDALRKHVSYRHPKENKDKVVGGNSKEASTLPTANNTLSSSAAKTKVTTNSDVKQEQT